MSSKGDSSPTKKHEKASEGGSQEESAENKGRNDNSEGDNPRGDESDEEYKGKDRKKKKKKKDRREDSKHESKNEERVDDPRGAQEHLDGLVLTNKALWCVGKLPFTIALTEPILMRKAQLFENSRIPPGHRMWISHALGAYPGVGETDIFYIPGCALDMTRKGKADSKYGISYIAAGIPIDIYTKLLTAISASGNGCSVGWQGSQEVKQDKLRWRLLNLKHDGIQIIHGNDVVDMPMSRVIERKPAIYETHLVFQLNITCAVQEGTEIRDFAQGQMWNVSFKYAAGLIVKKASKLGTQGTFSTKSGLHLTAGESDQELAAELAAD